MSDIELVSAGIGVMIFSIKKRFTSFNFISMLYVSKFYLVCINVTADELIIEPVM